MKKYIITLIAVCMSALVIAAPANKEILIKVFTPAIAWADSNIEAKILRIFSTQSNMNVQMVDAFSQDSPTFPENYFNTTTLLNWGKEVGGRYVMIVDIQSERLEKRKSFHLPLIFHKYQTYGIIEGEVRLFDLERNKLLAVKPIRVEEKGSRIFQATMDDDINDPDLHINAVDKIKFFSKLEDKFLNELRKKTKTYFGLR